MNFKNLVLIFLSIFSTNLNAAIINAGNFIQDTNTQLDWLKMNFTKGKSFDEILVLINSDQDFSGYSLASRLEVKTLFNNYYESNVLLGGSYFDGFNYNKTYNFVQLLGLTQEVQGSNSNQYWTQGYVTESFGSSKHYTVKLAAFDYHIDTDLSDEGKYYYQSSLFNDNVANENFGAFLVRSSISAVPEPTSFTMMCLGLLAMMRIIHRKKSQLGFRFISCHVN